MRRFSEYMESKVNEAADPSLPSSAAYWNNKMKGKFPPQPHVPQKGYFGDAPTPPPAPGDPTHRIALIASDLEAIRSIQVKTDAARDMLKNTMDKLSQLSDHEQRKMASNPEGESFPRLAAG